MQKKIVVANWKMYLSYDKVQQIIEKEATDLIHFLKSFKAIEVVLCPSFESLPIVKPIINTTNVFLGAQNCCAAPLGAYTGEVSAVSLNELGCSYVIIGHSERRLYHNESQQVICEKIIQCYTNNLIPIICIGEAQKKPNKNDLLHAIQEQLAEVLETLKGSATNNKLPFIIAYEPVWAIGSGIIPSSDYLNEACFLIKEVIDGYEIANSYYILYGGSVNEATILSLKNMPVDGFLIGKASINFQELKKIVSCLI